MEIARVQKKANYETPGGWRNVFPNPFYSQSDNDFRVVWLLQYRNYLNTWCLSHSFKKKLLVNSDFKFALWSFKR